MRTLLCACLLVSTGGFTLAQQTVSSTSAGLPTVRAAAAILFNAQTGEVLYKKNETDHRAVASTQKLLTALIVAESGNLSDLVTVTRSDTFADPTKLYLKPGEVYPRSQLLTALLVKSANDVARILARDNAGSVEQFAHKMNERMERLGGKSSHFINPNGLPVEGQYSTARDMACVARAAYYNPVLREIMKQRHFPFCFSNGRVSSLRNTNRVLRTYSFCNGMKTGYTDAAGHCLISSGSYNGKDMIAVVLGSNKARVWDESAQLLAYGLGLSQSQMASLRVDETKVQDDED
ncbi:D-alanyl-D-alanine carboxypeptidase [Terrimicrobium sacchariphilum]|jgi:D-alanyl-D-alanine carboxypeptidase (penicillin-binding protein 5/6)|uniref:D-alanyl-D-alanine carboxypeptidase n=1 Tax=Terrimicrobium sacchariphilum TaxID=690879 RepID=A0A146GA56_TERSA|nr:D-alanyl-D-alanine carboxypeptidase family protein [Terrimicrobium sacchariphilum]GAT33724.1 D-alanyl-D-alanine carboxypeptidase [Terrimicrobium sacchariphilum]